MPHSLINHNNIVLKFLALNARKNKKNVLELGDELVSLGADKLPSGGFWIWDINNNIEFYSPKFRQSLGFGGETDFPSTPESWKKQINEEDLKVVFHNYEQHLKTEGQHPYEQKVQYTKKDGSKIDVICSGTIIKNENKQPIILIGSHDII